MHRSTPLPRLVPPPPPPPLLPLLLLVVSILCRIGQTANIFRSSLLSTNSTAVFSPRSTTFNVPCHTLSRQSPPRQPPLEGLGGSLKTCALGILRRIRSMISSYGGKEEVKGGGIEVAAVLLGSVVGVLNRRDDDDAVEVLGGASNADDDEVDLVELALDLERAVARFNMVVGQEEEKYWSEEWYYQSSSSVGYPLLVSIFTR